LAQQVHAIAAAGLSVIFPKVSRKLESEANFSLRRVTKLAMVGGLFASSALALTMLLFGRQILSLWLGEVEANASADVLWYLVIAYWVLAANVVPYFILLGLGKMHLISISAIFAGSVAIVAMYLAMQSVGLTGAAAGRFAYAVITLMLSLLFMQYAMKEREKEISPCSTKSLE